VQVRFGERTLTRNVRAGYSYLACHDPAVHFGIGASSGVDEIDVRWIDGRHESFGPAEGSRSITLRRGEGRPPAL
jgi:hypothetical protein